MERATEIFHTLSAHAFPVMRFNEWRALAAGVAAQKPPNSHVMPVSDAFSLLCVLFWLASYLLIIRQAHADQSYGMPIYALCVNFTWELTFGFIYGPDWYNQILFAAWCVVDIFIFHAVLKYGPREFKHAPVIARNLGIICFGTFLMCLWGLLAYCSEGILVQGRKVVLYGGLFAQIFNGAGSIEQILSRNSTRGHSIHIWWTRCVGTIFTMLTFQYRVLYWPERFGYAGEPIASYLTWLGIGLDLLYPFAYYAVKKSERREHAVRRKNGKAH